MKTLRRFLFRILRHLAPRKPIAIFIGPEGSDPVYLWTWRDVVECESHHHEDQIIYFNYEPPILKD